MNRFRTYPPSSPIRKANRINMMRRRKVFCVVLISSPLLFYLFYLVLVPNSGINKQLVSPASRPQLQTVALLTNETTSPFLFDDSHLPKMRNILRETVGAILPISSTSGFDIVPILLSLLEDREGISQVGLVCSQDRVQEARTILRTALSSLERINHVEFTFIFWEKEVSQAAAMLRASSRLTADRIVFLPEQGIPDQAQSLFLTESSPLPFGPQGYLSEDEIICLGPLETTRAAGFLVPPFAAPASLLHRTQPFRNSESWKSFGDVVAKRRGDNIGGMVTDVGNVPWCPIISNKNQRTKPATTSSMQRTRREDDEESSKVTTGVVTLVLPHVEDLQAFSKAACGLQEDGNKVTAILYKQELHGIHWNNSQIAFGGCLLQCHVSRTDSSPIHLLQWLQSIGPPPDLVLRLDDTSRAAQIITSALASNNPHKKPTVIRLPRSQLQFCDWMGSLSIMELSNWHLPHMQIAVITNDRPGSLARLFASMQNAFYFGDKLNLRINLEQDADPQTHKLVEALEWQHGATFVSHRVVHGGLLPAVVESWYPHSNDSYGLLLEDDVELSPLFYAWVKMTLLRYRYGEKRNRSPHLFGISLYQQKNIETRLEGRQFFNARTTFAAENLAAYDTPYLSQIPCSWGAIYFPEHWREFHSYLGVRLSERAFSIDQVVVPETRSNRWTKSWKKYFIELVHLRGYVMLYPNFDQFISLSTNHLEVGSHVKDIPLDSYIQKKESFSVPLMQLPLAGKDSLLLDLPGKRLPPYDNLPTLDLFGDIASGDSLIERGRSRHHTLFPACMIAQETPNYDTRDLFCFEEPVIQNTID